MGEVISLPKVDTDSRIVDAIKMALDRANRGEFEAVCVIALKKEGKLYSAPVWGNPSGAYGLIVALHQEAWSLHKAVEETDGS